MLISDGDAGSMWHRTTLYVLQMISSGICIGLAVYVLYGDGSTAMTHEPLNNAEKGADGADGAPKADSELSPLDRIKALANLFTKK